ncbi:hypothetical protein PspLS_00928, partial [Pyricularia sp. CBS 133598]
EMSHYQGKSLQVPSYNHDGPGDEDSRHSRSGSVHSQAGSARGSIHRGSRPASDAGRPHSQSEPRPTSEAGKQPIAGSFQGSTGDVATVGQGGKWPAAHGFDPARDRDPSKEHAMSGNNNFNKNLDLPPEAYVTKLETPFAQRPGMGSLGKKITLQLNYFPILNMELPDIYLYDLSISPTPVKPEQVIKKCWNTPTWQAKLGTTRSPWIFNKRNLAWSTHKTEDGGLRALLDLDGEYGRTGGRAANKFNFSVRPVSKITMDSLRMYLQGKIAFNTHILECLNFLDHVLREGPSQKMIPIKRNFYSKSRHATPMGDGVIEVLKGIFASLRMSQSINDGKLGLGINVDVANTCFWVAQNFEDLVRNYLGSVDRRWSGVPVNQLANLLQPVMPPGKTKMQVQPSPAFTALRKLAKIKFTVKHRGKTADHKIYTLKRFSFDPSYGEEGSNAKTVKFSKRDGTTISVYDHFQKQYNVRLNHWKLPLIETTRDGFFPMEVCTVELYQRYNYKLDPDQTAKMIKFAVTRPAQRASDIMVNVNELRWNEDPYLKHFKIQVSRTMETAPARVIPNPEVQYKGAKVNPGVSGRWDLRGKVFSEAGTMTLQSFGVVIIDNCVDKAGAEAFMKNFLGVFKGHGGKIAPNAKPVVLECSSASMNLGQVVEKAYQAVGNANKAHPNLIFFILPNKSSINYERIKKSADCRYALVTQCMQAAHVRKNQAQYCSNVAMKVNAKLGGQTCKVATAFKKPTMMIGCDVSHAAPGAQQASMAAITVSMDKDCARYAAAVETNGYRCEILLPQNVRGMFGPLLERWCKTMRCAPEHVFYLRDGVAEGQFAHVMALEVAELRKVLNKVGNNNPKITVMVATKRHHIRFFPKPGDSSSGDRNGNALPGTVVERVVTHPFHYDFYLCSHVAIQGTARPTHYQVIHDEVGYSPDELQKMLYQQCYQYARSTTPVSLHPAIYYAHLASARGRCHENTASSEKDPKTKAQPGHFAKGGNTESSMTRLTESAPLLPCGAHGQAFAVNMEHFKHTMWYI